MAELRGVYIPTTEIWNTSEVEQAKIENAALKQLLVNMYMKLNRMATSIEAREFGAYPLDETMNGQKWFADPDLNSTTATTAAQRQAFRKVIIMPPLPSAIPPATAVISVAHGISVTANTFFTRLWAMAHNPTINSFLPIPYAFPQLTEQSMYIDADLTSVHIRTGTNRAGYTEVIAVIEYLQN